MGFSKKTTTMIVLKLLLLQSVLSDLHGEASPLKKFLLPPMLLAQRIW
ncbi:hypothetical protein Goarm_021962 [Gossypium armourianum]|uniref:Uncharacterized protein n=1 Tax=Gossypium armourianum TaxID=34283 RepID=A0A7J9IW05_9ROSI|nr:hypothetical protein [Gossypium armourianum]